MNIGDATAGVAQFIVDMLTPWRQKALREKIDTLERHLCTQALKAELLEYSLEMHKERIRELEDERMDRIEDLTRAIATFAKMQTDVSVNAPPLFRMQSHNRNIEWEKGSVEPVIDDVCEAELSTIRIAAYMDVPAIKFNPKFIDGKPVFSSDVLKFFSQRLGRELGELVMERITEGDMVITN